MWKLAFFYSHILEFAVESWLLVTEDISLQADCFMETWKSNKPSVRCIKTNTAFAEAKMTKPRDRRRRGRRCKNKVIKTGWRKTTENRINMTKADEALWLLKGLNTKDSFFFLLVNITTPPVAGFLHTNKI